MHAGLSAPRCWPMCVCSQYLSCWTGPTTCQTTIRHRSLPTKYLSKAGTQHSHVREDWPCPQIRWTTATWCCLQHRCHQDDSNHALLSGSRQQQSIGCSWRQRRPITSHAKRWYKLLPTLIMSWQFWTADFSSETASGEQHSVRHQASAHHCIKQCRSRMSTFGVSVRKDIASVCWHMWSEKKSSHKQLIPIVRETRSNQLPTPTFQNTDLSRYMLMLHGQLSQCIYLTECMRRGGHVVLRDMNIRKIAKAAHAHSVKNVSHFTRQLRECFTSSGDTDEANEVHDKMFWTCGCSPVLQVNNLPHWLRLTSTLVLKEMYVSKKLKRVNITVSCTNTVEEIDN